MDLNLPTLMAATRHTLADPRTAARQIIALDLPLQSAWLAVVLTAVLSALLAHISFALLPAAAQEGLQEMMANPVGTAIVQVIAAVAGVFAVHIVGRWRGGTGTLPQAAVLMAWLQFVMLVVQAAQIVAEVFLPPLALILAYAGVGLFLWLLVNFVMELHGFRSAVATFFGILGTMMVLGFLMALLIAPVLPVPVGG